MAIRVILRNYAFFVFDPQKLFVFFYIYVTFNELLLHNPVSAPEMKEFSNSSF